MNRSRLVAAGTSVGALIAITAGVAAANPAPNAKPAANRSIQTAPTYRGDDEGTPDQSQLYQDDGSNQWQQLPPDSSVTGPSVPDPSVTDPGLSGTTGNDFNQPPPFDPGAGGSGSANTSSGGS